jgi:hypothetical protein
MAAKILVKMLVSIGGLSDPAHGLEEFSFQPGQEVELHPDLARSWIAAGLAEAILERETASVDPQAETAILPPGSPKKPKSKS